MYQDLHSAVFNFDAVSGILCFPLVMVPFYHYAFHLQAVSNNRVEFNLFNGVHDLFIQFLFPSSGLPHSETWTFFFFPHLSLTCFLTKCLGFVFFCFFVFFFFLSVSFTTESRQYDIHSSQGKPSSFCASCDLWPSLGGQPQSISNYSSTISAHRHCSCSDETHFLWSAWRTGTWIFIQSIL